MENSFKKAFITRTFRIPSGEMEEWLKKNRQMGAQYLTGFTTARGALPIMIGEEKRAQLRKANQFCVADPRMVCRRLRQSVSQIPSSCVADPRIRPYSSLLFYFSYLLSHN